MNAICDNCRRATMGPKCMYCGYDEMKGQITGETRKCRSSKCGKEFQNSIGTNAPINWDAGVCSDECYKDLFVPGVMPKFPDKNQGLRYNHGKPRVDLIPGEVLLKLGEHYAYGAKKYHANNWVKGFPYSETLASLERHLYAFKSGEQLDPESGNHHLIAVIWNAVTLMFFELHPEVYAKFYDLLPDALLRVEKYKSTRVKTDLTGHTCYRCPHPAHIGQCPSRGIYDNTEMSCPCDTPIQPTQEKR